MRRLCPHLLGSFVQANAQRTLLLLSLALLVLCAALNSVKLDVDLASWVQLTTRIENELQAIDAAIGEGAGSNSLLILQTPKRRHQQQAQAYRKNNNKNLDTTRTSEDVLTIESFMIHLEAVAIATHVTIDLFDISWSLKDICFSPTLPDYEGLVVNQMLDRMMPCAIKTPLDCFWEGSKLMGPEQEVTLGSIGPKLKWTNLNPLLMVEGKKLDQPHTSFPYDTFISWMKRIGMTSGYQEKPCLDPTDPNCPPTAPNKLTGVAPNLGAELTGGCRGLAAKQMIWKEDEIVGGIERNRSGHIVRAEALQSTIQMMGERDVYDFWRKTNKVVDVNNWSTEKAKMVIDAWQKRFKEELAQFTRTSTSSAYKIQALTPKSMLEPIDSRTILDLSNFKLTILLMTILMCISYPNFEVRGDSKDLGANSNSGSDQNDKTRVDSIKVSRVKTFFMAIITSLIVILTFIASIGLSSLMDFPLNMATTQLLPPLALFYGYRQALMIATIYAKNYKHVPPADLTTESLNESLTILLLESSAILVPLVVAALFPVHATRVFVIQAIIYVVLSSSTAIFLVPALLVTFLIHNSRESSDKSIIYITYTSNTPRECISPSLLSIKSSKKHLEAGVKSGPSLEDQIFSRLQEDLRNIRADAQQPTDINFSMRADGSRTSFKLTTSRALGTNSTPPQRSPLPPAAILPDLLMRPANDSEKPVFDEDFDSDCEKDADTPNLNEAVQQVPTRKVSRRLTTYAHLIASKWSLQILICLFRLLVLGLMITQAPNVRYGLQLKDIVIRGTAEYDSFALQEKFFPLYNIFAITSGEFDYPSNQRLLYEFQQKISEVDGIVRDDEQQAQPKFWLAYFRDWLLELQEQFDQDRNKSAISSQGWTDHASDASKMAYKLLAQTGRADNPIDKNLVESNRLVDKNGIINQKAFYYYLTAWVMNDAFTYSNSEANLKPLPKTWNENPNDLRIERARPITYAQIPYLLKLPEDMNGLETIVEIRSISQAFEQLGLQNFPTGVPFIFWDQFINLDFLFLVMLMVVVILLLLIFGLFISDLNLSIIIIGPAIVTILELYGLLGYLSVHFNTAVAVLMMSSIGVIMVQTIQFAMVSREPDSVGSTSAHHESCQY